MFATKTLIKIGINTAIGAVLIVVWLQFVNIQNIFETIVSVNIFDLLPVFLFFFLSPSIRALRLKILLDPVKRISLKDLVFLNQAAALLNFLIPIRAGEIAKGIYLNTKYQVPLSNALIWVLLDRFIDFLAVLALASVLLLLIPTNIPNNFVIFLSLGFLLGAILAYLITYKQNVAVRVFNFFKPVLVFNFAKAGTERLFLFFLDSFVILRRGPRNMALLFAISAFSYLSDGLVWYFIFKALGAPQELTKMYLGQLLSALTYIIPAAPGYVGSAEASGLLIFSAVLGLPVDLASSMIVLFHMLTAIAIIIYGIISIYALKMDVSGILKKVFRKG